MTIVYMRTDPKRPLMRVLTRPLPCMNMDGTPGFVPEDFESDGSSVPELLRGVFPRHRHPVAFFRHDKRCRYTQNDAERLWADQEFKKDVRSTSWWITAQIGYIGVRIGAFFGVGSNYK